MKNAFQRALERYLQARRRDLKAVTIAHHRTHVNSLIKFLSDRYPEIDSPAELQRRPHIQGWLRRLDNRNPPYTKGTRDQIVRHVWTFLRDKRAWDWSDRAPPGLFRSEDFPFRRPRNSWQKLRETFPDSDSELHQDLKRYLKVRGATLSVSTLRYHKSNILGFVAFLQLQFPAVDSFAKLKRCHVEAWLQMLASRDPPYRNSSRGQLIGSVRRFFEDSRLWGWPRCPPEGLILQSDFPPQQRYLPKPLPPDVDAALMAALEERGDTRSLGLVVARRAGLRVGELGRLELNCLGENPDGSFSLRVPLGKLRSEREIPIDEHTVTLIKKIRSQRGERPTTIDPTTGRPVALLICHINGRVVSRTLFRKALKDTTAEYGIQENVYPHRLRHTYATEMLRYGVSLPGVMKLLGHTTIKMTLRYVQITNADLGREYLRAIERAVQHYNQLAPPEIDKVLDFPSDPLAVIRAAFDQIAARVQTLRCELPDPESRKNLQRFIERIRRAQKKLHELLE